MESAMIVVRDIFQLKFGKARDAKAILTEAESMMTQSGAPGFRVLTDLTGPSYTLVLESEYDSLGTFEADLQKVFANEEWRNWYQKFVPLVESGHREIFTVIADFSGAQFQGEFNKSKQTMQ
jgi:hypothetical protein